MDKQLLSVFRFEDYKINSIEFKRNDRFQYQDPLDIKFGLGVGISLENERVAGRVTIDLNVFENAEEINYPFSLKISISGYFSTDDECKMPRDKFEEYCKINGTAAMFPFLRSAVADITKAANMEPLVLPLVNIHNLIKNAEEESKENLEP